MEIFESLRIFDEVMPECKVWLLMDRLSKAVLSVISRSLLQSLIKSGLGWSLASAFRKAMTIRPEGALLFLERPSRRLFTGFTLISVVLSRRPNYRAVRLVH